MYLDKHINIHNCYFVKKYFLKVNIYQMFLRKMILSLNQTMKDIFFLILQFFTTVFLYLKEKNSSTKLHFFEGKREYENLAIF